MPNALCLAWMLGLIVISTPVFVLSVHPRNDGSGESRQAVLENELEPPWSPLGAPLEPPGPRRRHWRLSYAEARSCHPVRQAPGEDIGGRRTPRPEVVGQRARPRAKTFAPVVRRCQKLSASAPGPRRRHWRPSYAAARCCHPRRLAPSEDIGGHRTTEAFVVGPGQAGGKFGRGGRFGEKLGPRRSLWRHAMRTRGTQQRSFPWHHAMRTQETPAMEFGTAHAMSHTGASAAGFPMAPCHGVCRGFGSGFLHADTP